MQSIWESKISRKEYESLSENIERDIVVVGGGLAGLLTAYHLTKEGFNVNFN